MATVASQHDTETVALARADARAQGGRTADAMPYLPASSTPYPPQGVLDRAELSEAFCRRQEALVKWWEPRSAGLRRFWRQMAQRAQP